MADINDGGPAFPSEQPARIRMVADGVLDPTDPRNFAEGTRISPGMSKREYFAGQALCGWIQSGAVGAIKEQHGFTEPPMAFPVLADACCAVADAMIAAREKRGA